MLPYVQPMWLLPKPTIPYVHKVHQRAKRLKLSVLQNGAVVVTTPRFTPKVLIDGFVAKNQPWITEQLDRIQAKKPKKMTALATIFGKEYPLVTQFDKTLPVGITVTEQSVQFNPIQDPNKPENIQTIQKSLEKSLERYYKQTLQQYISLRIPQLAKKMGVSYTRISLRQQKTRWGSCSSTGALSFNWRLIHHPPAVIEYVLIHELAHRKQMNHSEAFWTIVRQHCPEYPKHRGWLKRTNIAEG